MNINSKKIIASIVVALFSIGWIFPLMKSFKQLCSWLYFSHQNNSEQIDSGVVLDIATGLFNISMLWLAVVIFLWTLIILLNKGK